MENLKINDKNYTFLVRYKNDETLRAGFNLLTRNTYRFDFEKWYKSGYWEDNCMLYSLADGDKIVSNITVNLIDFIVLGQKKQFVQLGTVMTDVDYRNKGLSRALMEKVMEEWENKADMIYLFANDKVLDFYPKFGFVPVNEYQAACTITKLQKTHTFRKLDMNISADRDLLYHTAKRAVPLFKISMQDYAGLVMFYANYFDRASLGDNLYYIEELQTIAIAEHRSTTLILHDVLALEKVEIEDVINALAQEQTEKAVLGFIPVDSHNYEISLYHEEDTTLFVQADSSRLFEDNKLRFSKLSYT